MRARRGTTRGFRILPSWSWWSSVTWWMAHHQTARTSRALQAPLPACARSHESLLSRQSDQLSRDAQQWIFRISLGPATREPLKVGVDRSWRVRHRAFLATPTAPRHESPTSNPEPSTTSSQPASTPCSYCTEQQLRGFPRSPAQDVKGPGPACSPRSRSAPGTRITPSMPITALSTTSYAASTPWANAPQQNRMNTGGR